MSSYFLDVLAFITIRSTFSLLDVIYFLEYTVQSMKAVDDQAAGVAKKKARVLAAAVGEAFYAVRFTLCLHLLSILKC